MAQVKFRFRFGMVVKTYRYLTGKGTKGRREASEHEIFTALDLSRRAGGVHLHRRFKGAGGIFPSFDVLD